MAVEDRISPAAKAENDARGDLAAALRSLHYIRGGNPDEVIAEFTNALDRYIEAKLQPRRY